MFNISVLASGSSGNCTFVEAGKTKLLFDAGVNCKQVFSRLKHIGKDLSEINGIFVSHEHVDHIRGIDVIKSRYNIPLHINEKTLVYSGLSIRSKKDFKIFKSNHGVQIDDVHIETFNLSHDAVDPVGFVVNYKNKKLGIITDLGFCCKTVKEKFAGLNAVVLESNHDSDMLRNGFYPEFLKRRIAGREGHLSNKEAANLVFERCGKKLGSVFLAHLSENNNTPELAIKTFESIVKNKHDLKDLNVYLTSRHHNTDLIEIR